MPMTFDEARIEEDLVVTSDVEQACRFLEAQGFHYAEDFQVSNAIEYAGAAILEIEGANGFKLPS